MEKGFCFLWIAHIQSIYPSTKCINNLCIYQYLLTVWKSAIVCLYQWREQARNGSPEPWSLLLWHHNSTCKINLLLILWGQSVKELMLLINLITIFVCKITSFLNKNNIVYFTWHQKQIFQAMILVRGRSSIWQISPILVI